MSLVLDILDWDPRPDSPNRTRGQHWARRASRSKLARTHVWVALNTPRRALPALPFTERVRLTATVFMRPRQRALDPDNATASLKPLIDALVKEGVLANDTPKHIAIAPVTFTRSKNPSLYGVRLELAPITTTAAASQSA